MRTFTDTNPEASVSRSKIISQEFKINKGTKGGCSLSPLPFALALEPLTVDIRKDPDIPGIEVGSSSHKVMPYVDNALVLITGPEHSLPSLFIKTIKLFSRLSGYKVVDWGVPNLVFYHYLFSHLMHYLLRKHPPLFGTLCVTHFHLCVTSLVSFHQSHSPIISHLRWVWKRIGFLFNFNANLHTVMFYKT